MIHRIWNLYRMQKALDDRFVPIWVSSAVRTHSRTDTIQRFLLLIPPNSITCIYIYCYCTIFLFSFLQYYLFAILRIVNTKNEYHRWYKMRLTIYRERIEWSNSIFNVCLSLFLTMMFTLYKFRKPLEVEIYRVRGIVITYRIHYV